MSEEILTASKQLKRLLLLHSVIDDNRLKGFILTDNLIDSKTQSALIGMWWDVCRSGGNLSFKILSNSMSPTLEAGDEVRVSRVEPAEVHIGDILAFQEGQKVVVHRVIHHSRSGGQFSFRHRGDVGGVSGKITERQLIGRVRSIKKEKGCEIALDTRWATISNRVLGWRLRFMETLGRQRPGLLKKAMHQSLKVPWKLCHHVFLR